MRHLCVCTQGAKLSYMSHRITVGIDGDVVRSVPIEPLESIEVYGNIHMTTPLIQELMRRNISVGMYSTGGFYIGRISNPDVSGRAELVKAQVLRSMDENFRIKLARNVIRAKIHNQKIVLRRYIDIRNTEGRDKLRQMDILEKRVDRAVDINEIMGIEGSAARLYFSGLGNCLESPLNFRGRNRRPSKDPFNSLVNYGYSVLQNQVQGKIDMRGLDSSIGMIHSSHGNKKALSFDIMEEWRPVIVDSLAMHCLSSREIGEQHFELMVDGSLRLTREGLCIYKKKIEDRYETTSSYLKLGGSMTFRKALNYQVDQYAKALLESDVSIYSPCRIR